MNQARYRDGDNSVLRSVLHRLWRSRCYSCERPTDYTEIEIDHLIPKGLTEQERKELLLSFRLPADFDLDRPANLAPICGRCNRKKSNDTIPTATMILAMRLNDAAKLEPKVIAAVNTAISRNQIGTSLRQVNGIDLTLPKVREAFLDEAPAIVQKLALIDPARADFIITESVDLDLETLQVPVLLSLNARGRTAITLIEEICGCPLADALAPGVDALIPRIADMAQSSVEALDDSAGPLTAAPPECEQLRLTVDELDFDREGTELALTFEGTFESQLVGSVVRSAANGDGLDELQGDSEAAGRFTLWVTWNITDMPGSPCGASAEISDWALPYVSVWSQSDAERLAAVLRKATDQATGRKGVT